MLIRQVRLKNIKSFGQGETGNGVQVHFDRGLNRIGGKNGAGKSSIIEAIGYALFDAEPIRGDNRMPVGTYLVRDGYRTGNIDVLLESSDGLYLVERDAGRMERRWKVLREDDGYTEAEGNDEVKRFLAKLFGVSGPERLSELFHSLIGVKQGRFTTYFDCKASEAKAHFDPLLDVDIFRKCFEDLLEPLRMVQRLKTEQELAISGYSGEIEQLKTAPEELAACQGFFEKAQIDLELISGAVISLEAKLKKHEQTKQQKIDAEQDYLKMQGAVQQQQVLQNNAIKEVVEAEAAAKIVQTAVPDYQAYQAADNNYKLAEIERVKADELLQKASDLKLATERWLAEKQQRSEAIELTGQDIVDKQNEGSQRRVEVQRRTVAYQAMVEVLAEQARQQQELGLKLDSLKEWRITLQEQQKQFEAELAKLVQALTEIKAIDPQGLAVADQEYQLALQVESDARVKLAQVEQEQAQLQRQLESLQDGICPFLGEVCQQFSPERIQGQVAQLSRESLELKVALTAAELGVKQGKVKLDLAQVEQNRLSELEQRIRQSESVLSQCYGNLEQASPRQAAESLGQLWPTEVLPELPFGKVEPIVLGFWQEVQLGLFQLLNVLRADLEFWNAEYNKLQTAYQESNAEKEKEKAWLDQETMALKQLGADIGVLQKRVEADRERISVLDQTLATLELQLTQIRTELEQYGDLKIRMKELREQLEATAPQYTLYLQHQPLAEQLGQRQAGLKQALAMTAQAEQDLAAAVKRLEIAKAAFDEVAFVADKQEQQRYLDEQGQARNKVQQIQTEVVRQEKRVKQLQELELKREAAWNELDRLEAQSILLEKARNVLKNSQGLVAQGLATRIQGRAQEIYNSMSSEPVQFEWSADDYKLTVCNISGERRFTQLSGGQQMKAAIAMQLALVKEFSKAGICAFDEPTYGLDVDSRQMLAEAIAAVYRECNFEQLFVVSHDVSFDDKVEHVVDLRYSGVNGTVVEEA